MDEVKRAIGGVSIDIKPGDFVAILGHNGSGKSTLAKHLNGILLPTEGTVVISGMDTANDETLLELRKKVGMVFQNPDNQIIGQVVEEDVAFGPENMGVPTEEIRERVKSALNTLEIYEYRNMSPNRLSGGQKQRVSIAGVIAMKPKCIILDEPTAMLDPGGRAEVIEASHKLNKEENITVLLITHHMDEAINADCIYVMDNGSVVMSGTPTEIFSRVDELQKLKLTAPEASVMAFELRKRGIDIPDGILTEEELAEKLNELYRLKTG